MNELQIFNNEEFGEIRTVEIEGEPYFVGKDVAVILGYKDTADAIKRHVDDDDKLTRCFTDSESVPKRKDRCLGKGKKLIVQREEKDQISILMD